MAALQPAQSAGPRDRGWREAALERLALDPTGWQPVAALRAAIGVTVPLVVGLATGQLTYGVIAAAGALPSGVAGYTGVRARWTLVLATTAGMTVATFVGSVTAGHTVARVLVLIGVGFFAGLVVTLGRSASLIGTQALIGLTVFGRFPSSAGAAVGHAGLVAAGGALQALLIGLRPPVRFANERSLIARALTAMADQAARLGVAGSGGPSGTALAEAADVLGRRLDTTDTQVLRGIIDASSRVRLEVSSLGTVADSPGVADLLTAASRRLRQLADAIRGAELPADEDGALSRAADGIHAAVGDSGASPAAAGVTARYADARAQALLGQMRALDRQAAALAGLRRLVLPSVVADPAPVFLSFGNRIAAVLRRIRLVASDRSSTAWRHAVRLSATLATTEVVAAAVPWQRGYWITLTAAVVLKPDYAATMQRGLARVVGTGFGAVGAGLIIDGLHPAEPVEVVLIAAIAWASYAVFAASYAIYSLVVSALVVVLLSPAGAGSLSTALDRGLSTLVGGALAIVAIIVWPTWERTTLPLALRRLLAALARYADVVLAGYVHPHDLNPKSLAAAADEARRARAAAQASRDRAAAEPTRVATDVSTATGVLAAASRIVVVLHALRTTLEGSEQSVSLPEAEQMRAGVVGALDSLAATTTGPELTGLRDEQQRLTRTAASRLSAQPADVGARRMGVLASQLDPLVDSVDTVGHLMHVTATDGR